MKKRFLSILLALSLALSLLPGGALAAEAADGGEEDAGETAAEPEEPVTEGSCGETLAWSLDELSGILSISGSGEMYDYAEPASAEEAASKGEAEEAPWNGAAQSIRTVAIDEGVTALGENAFAACSALTEVCYFGSAEQWNAVDTANLLTAGLTVTAAVDFCTITFDAGVASDDQLDESSQDMGPVVRIPGAVYELPECTYALRSDANGVFVGWRINGSTEIYRVGYLYPIPETATDVKLTAAWWDQGNSGAGTVPETPGIVYAQMPADCDNSYNAQNNTSYTVSEAYDQVLPLHYPTRPGYNFTGWEYLPAVPVQPEITISGKDVRLKAGYNKPLLLQAQWEKVTYTITVFDAEVANIIAEGGYEISTGDQTVKVTLADPNAVPRGRTLAMEYLTGGTGGVGGLTFDGLKVNIPAGYTGHLVLVGQVVPKTFPIDYQLGEGGAASGAYPASFQYSETDPVEFTLADPTKSDYDFDGWECNYAGITIASRTDGDTSTKITVPADFDTDQMDAHGEEIPVTFTARWKPHEYKVAYDLGEDNPDTSYPEKTYTIEDFTDGELSWLLDDPVWAGRIFREWTCGDAKVTLEPYEVDPDTTVTRVTLSGTGDFTITARWEDVYYTISFDPNGGQGNMAGVKVKYGDEYLFPACTIRPQNGKEFDCWTVTVGGVDKTPEVRQDDDGNDVYYCRFTEDVTDVVFTAHWKDKIYKVSFDNGLEDAANQTWEDPRDYPYDDIYTVPDWDGAAGLASGILLPPGRAFDGWSVETSGSVRERKPGEFFHILDDVSLTARWLLHDYTVVFDPTDYRDDPYYAASDVAPVEGVHIDTEIRLPAGYTLTQKPLTPIDPDDPTSVPEPPAAKVFKGWEIDGQLYAPGAVLPIDGDLVYGIQPDAEGRRVIPAHAVWDDASNQAVLVYETGYTTDTGNWETCAVYTFPGVTVTIDSYDAVLGGKELPGMRFRCWNVMESVLKDDGTLEWLPPSSGLERRPGEPYFIPDNVGGKLTIYLTARWEGDIAYDLNGGGYYGPDGQPAENPNPTVYAYNESLQELSAPLTPPTRAGYIFLGWTCEDPGVDIQDTHVFLPEGFTGTLTLKASWEKDSDTCIITYSPGAGTGEETTQEVAKNTEITLPECGYTPPVGQVFKAWSVNGQEQAPGSLVAIVDDTLIVAVWEDDPDAAEFTVTIQPGEGSGAPVSAVYAKGEVITLQSWSDYGFTAPAGKAFDCWDVNGTPAAAGSAHTVDRTLVITALWKPLAGSAYTVTYEPGEGTGSPVVVEDVPAGPYTLRSWQSCGFTAPTGKEFDCWSVGGVRVTEASYSLSGSTTFTALWKDQSEGPDNPDPPVPDVWTVTFDPNGGTGTMAPVSVPKGQTYTLPACTFTPPQGREFKAWRVNGQEYAPGAAVNIVSNTVVAAVWQAAGTYLPPGTYAINYYLSGGSSRRLQDSYTVSIRDQVLNLIDPVKEGHTFLGWTYEGQAEPVYTVVIPAGFTGELLLTAVWEKDGAAAPPDGGSDPSTPSLPGAQYADVAADAWYYEAVRYVSSRGLMTGTDAFSFSPNGTMSRAMLWTVLARMGGGSVSGGVTWYEGAMNWVQSHGIADGESPNAIVTREELVTLLWRYMGSPKATNILRRFSDGMTVSSWAAEAVSWAAANGILNGSSGSLNPQKQATRAEVASVLMRFLQYRAA